MRLQDEFIGQIRRIAKNIYGDEVHVFLFGSRVNDNARGGDIDLLIESPEKEKMNFENKVKFLTALKLKIGDQKIDVIYNKKKERRDSDNDSIENQKVDIVAIARKKGVKL